MIYYIRCSLNGKKYWYYAGTERVNGKVEPCYIDQIEYNKTHRVQEMTKQETNYHLKRIKEQNWRNIEVIGMK